jgi:hypothetical protein
LVPFTVWRYKMLPRNRLRTLYPSSYIVTIVLHCNVIASRGGRPRSLVWPIASTLGRTGTVFCPLHPPFRVTSVFPYRWNRSDLKKLTTPVISDDLLLALWKNRLPNTMWTILSLAKITSANDLTMMTQRIHEARLGKGR